MSVETAILFFCCLWTKVHQIECTCAGEIAVAELAVPFSVRRYSFRDQVRKLSEICPKLWCFWAANFSVLEGPKFLTQFYKLGSPSNMCENLVTIDQATSEIRRWKKKKKPLGVATGDISVFIPPKSAQVNFLWGKNDVRTAIQQFYIPQKLLYPQNKFLATPLVHSACAGKTVCK